MRNLVSIRKIEKVSPIQGADNIEVATVGGWEVVVQKGEFKSGDLAVYFEIDSWIPDEIAPFLSKGKPQEYGGVLGTRLRTVRLRGQISQGLLLPLSVLEGKDLSTALNIQKWEATIPAELSGNVRGAYPTEIPKTHQNRIQNLSDKLVDYYAHVFEVTEKLDGTSCTFYLDSTGEFHVCGHDWDMEPSDTNSYWEMANKYSVKEKMQSAGLCKAAIQGELIGPGIQGNPYKLKSREFYVFDIYDVPTGQHLTPVYRRSLVEHMGLLHVPVLQIPVIAMNIEVLLKIADGPSQLNPNVRREGIVLKSTTDTRVHFKVVSNEYLLK